jgi:LuxR family maltose regulon positive regulatory protein
VAVAELTGAAHSGLDRLPPHRAKRLRVVLDLVAMADARVRGDLVAVAVAGRRIPTDPAALATLGLASWDVLPLMVLSNAGSAELWTGDTIAAEKHLRAVVETDRSGDVLRPHLNAAAHLALLRCERGELAAAHDAALAVVERATTAGWTVSPQVSTAYLALARVALERDEHPDTDRWLARVAEVQAVLPEPPVQLAAAALSALRRADGGDLEGALSGLLQATASAAGTTPPVLADQVRLVQADLLRRLGDIEGAGTVLAALHGPGTAGSARAAAWLHLHTGDHEAADGLLARYPEQGTTVRGRVEDAVLRSTIAAVSDRAVALSRLEDALLAAAPLGMRRPFLVHAARLRELLAARIEAGTSVAAFAVDLTRRMAGRASSPAPVQVAALTDREQVILRYLASTLSNAEIAVELYLSVNTVKTHQRMVYRKLSADGRRDAVRRGKELRLI